jgi:hypothetical protein
LTQFERDYNWICRCINKKSPEDLNSYVASATKFYTRGGVDFVPGDEALNQSPLTGGAGKSACF